MSNKIIFRCDDVSPNIDINELEKQHCVFKKYFSNSVFWACVNVFGYRSDIGSVYPNPPFKNREKGFFYDVNKFIKELPSFGEIVSHGMLHIDHTQLDYDAQEMSIMTSCNYLKTYHFVPPFNRWNDLTERVCSDNGVVLCKSFEEGWKSLEHEEFDPSHKLWYYHPWRWSAEQLEKKISESIKEAKTLSANPV